MKHLRRFLTHGMMVSICSTSLWAQGMAAIFKDDFSAGMDHWRPYLAAGEWTVADGVLRAVKGGDSARLTQGGEAADVLIETKVRFLPSSVRRCFGLVLRAQEDGSCIVMRYYDSTDSL